MNNSRLRRAAALWIVFSISQALLVATVWGLLNYVQSQLKVASTELELAAANLLSGLHAVLSWPVSLLMFSDAPESIFVGAAVLHFALWGAVWLTVWRFVRRVQLRSAHEG
jgi:hypothetical protein